MSTTDFDNELDNIHARALRISGDYCRSFFDIAYHNSAKILAAFRKHRVSDSDFKTGSGYGYNDCGRDKLDNIWADICCAEAALFRTQFVSGTHALTTVLFGILRPGDTVLSITGEPYDTLHKVLGHKNYSPGSLRDWGVNYAEVNSITDDSLDLEIVTQSVNEHRPKMVLIQRSRGYSLRRSLTIAEIESLCQTIKAVDKQAIIFVDNCYGEFMECREPVEAGADIIAGSLIKNPGGGLAPCGGYIAGRKDLVELAGFRLTSPGLGAEVGPSLCDNRLLYQGLFVAPHVVGQALQTAIYSSSVFTQLGYPVYPATDAVRTDIIQAIELGSAERVIAFCQALQAFSPVDSYVKPVAWDMPGYKDQVIMAAGTFVQGASIELSADAPMRNPYAVYLQGGIVFEQSVAAILAAAKAVSAVK
ncbi:MAG: methionine gamma-lyase family protein [Negativicutes bacterium]